MPSLPKTADAPRNFVISACPFSNWLQEQLMLGSGIRRRSVPYRSLRAVAALSCSFSARLLSPDAIDAEKEGKEFVCDTVFSDFCKSSLHDCSLSKPSMSCYFSNKLFFIFWRIQTNADGLKSLWPYEWIGWAHDLARFWPKRGKAVAKILRQLSMREEKLQRRFLLLQYAKWRMSRCKVASTKVRGEVATSIFVMPNGECHAAALPPREFCLSTSES